MSKQPYPLQKGADLFPSTMRQPTVVRFYGIDPKNVEDADALQDRAGEINRFVTACRQDYALSDTTQLKRKRQIRDGEVRYLNQGGNELVEVRIELPKHRGAEKRKRVWDWAVINIVAPDAVLMSMSVIAYLIPPPAEVPPGVAADNYNLVDASDGIALAYPVAEDATHDDPDTSQRISSLRVDLRRFRGWSAVGIDLYGTVVSLDYPVIPWRYRRVETSSVDGQTTLGDAVYVSGSPTTFSPDASTFYAMVDGIEDADLNSDTTTVLVGDAPLVPDMAGFGFPDLKKEYEYDPVSGLMTKKIEHQTLACDPGTGLPPVGSYVIGDTYTFIDFHNTQTFDIVLDTTLGPAPPITRDCDVRVAMWIGTPEWSVTTQPDPGDGFIPARWDDRYPDRDNGIDVGQVTMDGTVTPPTDAGNHYGLPYLGRVTIDLEHGAATFKPA